MESLDLSVIISVVVLGLSVLATAAKFLDWFIHSDAATMVRTTRWTVLLLLAVCVPILIFMIVRGYWSEAMLLGAGMLFVPTILKWHSVFAPLRAAFGRFRRKPRPFDVFDMEVWDPETDRDPETVRRAAAILEAYVSQAPNLAGNNSERTSEEMSEAEALDVLGLKPGAEEAEIRAAHRRLIRLVHPDHAGSTYLSRKVSLAKDTLLPGSRNPRSVLRAGANE